MAREAPRVSARVMVRPASFSPALLAFALLASGCAATIPNTDVADTPENREVLDFMEMYRHAVEEQDVGRLLSLAAPDYLDHAGTLLGDDDIDYGSLERALTAWEGRVLDVRYNIRYRRVTRRDPNEVHVEFRYAASFKVRDPDGNERWNRRVGDQRAILVWDEESDEYHFLSGM